MNLKNINNKILNLFKKKKLFFSLFLLLLIIFSLYFIFSSRNDVFNLDDLGVVGEEVQKDFALTPVVALAKNENGFEVKDDLTSGIEIKFASQTEEQKKEEANKKEFKIQFPGDYLKPIEIKLDPERVVTITDQNATDYKSNLLAKSIPLVEEQKTFFKKEDLEDNFVAYENERKSIYYAYQKDQALNERKLKNWIIYNNPAKNQTDKIEEKESYKIENAKIKLNEAGEVEVFYFGQKEIQNEKTMAEVEPSLLERAQKTLEKEMGEDLINNNQSPDFTIPKPYYINSKGERIDLNWEINSEENIISLNFSPKSEDYPLAMDPTLSFTAPGVANGGDVIAGEANSYFGYSMTSGDFNADGKIDLAVGAYGYSTNTGRAYIFYNDGSVLSSVAGADIVITGEATGNKFGAAMTSGDFNTDGKTDLLVGAYGYSTNTGRAYIFYNDGSISTTAATADVIITGEASSMFGWSMTGGDFNADGKIDLAVGAMNCSSSAGCAYIFYGDGSIPTTAAAADVKITGETSSQFGDSMTSGDFNADGKTDLTVGARSYSSSTGRVYIFYNDGSIPTTAATANVIITGETTNNFFGRSMSGGDFNADGKTDLAVGAHGYSSLAGRAYIFYNDGSIPTTAATADVKITGETSSQFGDSMTSGDFNTDGKTDLAVGAYYYTSGTGRAYIFYNDGSIPTTAVTADVIITGETTNNFFGRSMSGGDFNADGKTDLAVGAEGYSTNTGRTYIFYSQNGQVNTNFSIAGESAGNSFGWSMTSGDFNADGKTDLAVGAYGYTTNTGRAYIFYNDGSIPTTTATADVIITGGTTSNSFGFSMTSGDFNADGKTDLAVGAYGYTTNTGCAYIFYNDGSIPTTAATADVIITGETTNNNFGYFMTGGDFNADGKIDLAVGAYRYSSNTGRAYIFYNDGSIPTTAATADVIITGEGASSYFGTSMTSGDFNADGKTDLAVGAYGYSSGTGRAYIFYNDGSIPTTAITADVIITGEASSNFGFLMTSGDFNADGRTDLAVAGDSYSSYTGRAYIFYNDGSISTTAATADVIITGEVAGSDFGSSMTSGDFNADGKTDLAVGALNYSSYTGRAYIFYNDGSIPTAASTADVIITDEATNNFFGYSMIGVDFNADGKADLAVGASGYSSSTGRVYIYETRDDYAWQVQTQPGGLRINPKAGQEMKITGEASGSYFGYSMTSGDFNADGKVDLAIGGSGYSSDTGRTYIFYNDGSIPTIAATADVIITGEASSSFGVSMTSGDFNADGKTDLAVGAYGYSSYTGRAYIFYNDGSIPIVASSADIIITGEAANNYFGFTMINGDFNFDGKTDLAVGAYGYSSVYGRAYIFYNDGTIPTTAATADVIITGEAANNSFGYSMTSGDFNSDGRVDFVAGAYAYSSGTGRTYIFYNDGSISTTAATADVIITGEASSYFGYSMTGGDFNVDGRIDLVVGGYGYSTSTGRAYIFYNDGSIPTTAATANVIITGESSSSFGTSMTSGDFNADGKTDLAVGANGYSTNTGRAYVFHNDGTIPTTAASADIIITGEASSYFGTSMISGDFNVDGRIDLIVGAYSSNNGNAYIYTFNDSQGMGGTTNNSFGVSMTSGDFNADGKTDLAVGAYRYSSQTGRAYIFYNNNGSISPDVAKADVMITGEATSNNFGYSMISGDFNADSKIDLVVGAEGYSSWTGRAYIFYNDGSIPTTAATADVRIVGENTGDSFGHAMTSGDFNTDGRTDLAVGSYLYSTSAGRVYIFYNDGSIPTTAATADVIITGEASGRLGASMTSGDFNFDGKIDLVIGAYQYSTSTGRAYIFYNDGSIPTTATTADVIITGEVTNDSFGYSMTSGDFNADSKTDLAIGAYGYSSWTGRAYIFYNDGSIPTTAATADAIVTGEVTGDSFGISMIKGDFNSDSKTDLVVGANGYSSYTGRAYIFYSDSYFPTDAVDADNIITGETTDSQLGVSMTNGDFNVDGKTDLVVGADGYSSNTGKIYVIISEAKAEEKINVIKQKGTIQLKGGSVKMK